MAGASLARTWTEVDARVCAAPRAPRYLHSCVGWYRVERQDGAGNFRAERDWRDLRTVAAGALCALCQRNLW